MSESSTEIPTFCRLCMGHCGVLVKLDGAGRVASIRGDHEDPQTLGYACFKGMQSGEAHASPGRILHPLKRVGERGSGEWKRVSWEEALTAGRTLGA